MAHRGNAVIRALVAPVFLPALALAGVAVLAAVTEAARQDPVPPSEAPLFEGLTADARVVGALEELWHLGVEDDQEAVARRLSALSGAERAFLGGLAITYGPEAAGDPGSAWRREILVGVLRDRGPDLLRGPLREASASDDLAVRRAALRMLGEVGDRSHVELLFDAVAERGGRPLDPCSRDLFEEALGRVLARDAGAYAALPVRDQQFPEVEVCVVRAIGAAGRVEGLSYLIDAVTWQSIPAETVLAEIARLAPKVRGPCAARLGSVLIELASHERPQVRQAAVQALGRLGCREAVGLLVDLLAAEHRGVRESAHWALSRITGQSMPLQVDRWRAWHQKEQQWFDSRGSSLVADLSANDPARVAEALHEAALHPLFAEALSPGLADAVLVAQAETRLLALQVIEIVRATATAPTLPRLLEEDDRPLAERVHAALRLLSGIEGPTSADEWHAALLSQGECSY